MHAYLMTGSQKQNIPASARRWRLDRAAGRKPRLSQMVLADEALVETKQQAETPTGDTFSSPFCYLAETETFQLFLFIQLWGCSVWKAACTHVDAGASATLKQH